MKFNIQVISHPLIQYLSNTSTNSSMAFNIRNQATRYLGLFILYETLRKWITVYQLTIKQIKLKKRISLLNPKESYLIIFNNLNYLNMFQEIQLLLPKVNLQLAQYKNISIMNIDSIKCSNTLNEKIVIVNEELDTDYVKDLINSLVNKKGIKINQIYLTCIKCTTNQLVQLGENKRYKDLHVYTTQIIE